MVDGQCWGKSSAAIYLCSYWERRLEDEAPEVYRFGALLPHNGWPLNHHPVDRCARQVIVTMINPLNLPLSSPHIILREKPEDVPTKQTSSHPSSNRRDVSFVSLVRSENSSPPPPLQTQTFNCTTSNIFHPPVDLFFPFSPVYLRTGRFPIGWDCFIFNYAELQLTDQCIVAT